MLKPVIFANNPFPAVSKHLSFPMLVTQSSKFVVFFDRPILARYCKVFFSVAGPSIRFSVVSPCHPVALLIHDSVFLSLESGRLRCSENRGKTQHILIENRSETNEYFYFD